MSHRSHHMLGSRLTDKGVEFGVWAPFASTVSVLVGEPYNWQPTELQRDEDGNWFGFVPDAQAGQSYKYQITTHDGTILEKNDPRARQLTASDDGVSIIIDPFYDWGDVTPPHTPKESQVIYELHIGTFHRPDAATVGTFTTAIDKLDYLAMLGVTAIELMPITSMAMSNGWGYAPNYLFSVENAYGGRHGLLDFVRAAHEKGIAVILDVVYNHFFPSTDLWQYDGWSEKNRGGIYFYNDERGDTPWGGRPDYGRREVREYILDNVAMWFSEYRIDGLRIDSTIYMRNTKGPEGDETTAIPEAWTLLQEITTLAHKIRPDALLIAEDSSVEPRLTQPTGEGGAGFDAQWGLAFPHTIRSALGLEKDAYGDTFSGELLHTYNDQAFQKVIFSDSHDTAANGSVRLNEAVTPGNAASIDARQHTLVASIATLTAPGIPLLLQGQEFLQEGAFNDWQMLEWDKATQFDGIVLAHQHAIRLRRNQYGNTAGLTGRKTTILHQNDTDHVIAFIRTNGVADTLVIINFGASDFDEYQLTIPSTTWRVRFNSTWHGYSPDFQESAVTQLTPDEQGNVTLPLQGYSALILSTD